MADKKISQLTPATTPLAGTETLPIVQGGNTVKTTVQDVANLAGAPYKVYTALLTQSGGTGVSFITSGTLTIGVTYFIDDPAGGDWTNVGAPNNNAGTYFVATGTTPNAWNDGALAYNTGAPVVTVLQNTIGNIYWTYTGEGQYTATLNGAFTVGKTVVFVSSFNNGNDYNISTNIYQESSNFLQLNTFGNTGDNLIELNANVGYKLPIEIRVYN